MSRCALTASLRLLLLHPPPPLTLTLPPVLPGAQVLANTAVEEVLHLLPSVKALNVMLVGPEWKTICPGPSCSHFDKEVCPPCTRLHCSRRYSIYRWGPAGGLGGDGLGPGKGHTDAVGGTLQQSGVPWGWVR